MEAELPLGDGTQTPDEFARIAVGDAPGCPSTCARSTWRRTHFVLTQHGQDSRLPDARAGS